MIKLMPLILLGLGFFLLVQISAWAQGRNLRRNSRPLHNDQTEALLRRLADAAGVDKIEVRVLEQPMINGLATPSGEIYVTRGLFQQVQKGRITGPEFASVVAHELGHLALGHARRRMVDVAGAQAVHMLLGGLLSRFIPVVGWYVARWLSGFFIASLSRRDEFEADRYATAVMMKSGLGAEAQARMLEKLNDLMPGANPAGASWLASHPPVPQRAEKIRANAERWNAAR